jgi:hypothetical protein
MLVRESHDFSARLAACALVNASQLSSVSSNPSGSSSSGFVTVRMYLEVALDRLRRRALHADEDVLVELAPLHLPDAVQPAHPDQEPPVSGRRRANPRDREPAALVGSEANDVADLELGCTHALSQAESFNDSSGPIAPRRLRVGRTSTLSSKSATAADRGLRQTSKLPLTLFFTARQRSGRLRAPRKMKASVDSVQPLRGELPTATRRAPNRYAASSQPLRGELPTATRRAPNRYAASSQPLRGSRELPYRSRCVLRGLLEFTEIGARCCRLCLRCCPLCLPCCRRFLCCYRRVSPGY